MYLCMQFKNIKRKVWKVLVGLGTEIISLIVGLISGGAIGYKIGIHNRIKQSQKAGNNSRQTQISSINYGVNK